MGVNPRGVTFKPKEVKDPEPFTGIQTDLKRFMNQLALVLADVGCFTDIQTSCVTVSPS